MTWALIVLLAAGLAIAPVMAERRRWAMDSQARALAPGQFADLPQGKTHYMWDGPAKGPVVVCVHGLTTSSYVWDAVVRGLVMMGFRVLRYDLYGRGLSDRPKGPQDRAFFLTQLQDLLSDQGLGNDLTLVGYSMGGSICTAFAAQAPTRVSRLVLLAPAGLGVTPTPLAEFCRRVPVLGDWTMAVFGGWHIRQSILAKDVGPVAIDDIAQMQADETRFKGFLAAVLSSQRHMLAQDQAEDHRAIARAGLPVLAIWGGEDQAIPLTAMGRMTGLNRAVRHVELPAATHALPYTHPREIHGALQGFLRET